MSKVIKIFLLWMIIIASIFYLHFNIKNPPSDVSRPPSKLEGNGKHSTYAYYISTDSKPTGGHHAYRSYSHPKAAAETNETEQLLKYVLFSVKYDPTINAGETKSLQLTMSPKNKLRNLEKAIQENKIKQNQINAIEKVQSQYKYVSAKLLAQDNCLQIEKKMPEEDKVYLPSVNESAGDQVWQWDLSAPHTPLTNVCHLSLFIRFCLNQNDCIPLTDPDREFNIFIEITLVRRIYNWLFGMSHISSIIIPILTIIGIVGSLRIWRKKQPDKK